MCAGRSGRGGAAALLTAERTALNFLVEVQSLDDVDAALEAGVTMVKVDGLPIDAVRETVWRSRGRAKVEVSGPVPLDWMAELAQTGAEYVSIAQLTQAVIPIEMTFELASDVAPQTGAQRR